MKIFDECEIRGNRLAILINEEEKIAMEAVWDQNSNRWETDFCYPILGIEADEVAGNLDFYRCKKQGYEFID